MFEPGINEFMPFMLGVGAARGQVEKVDFFLGRFLKNSAANRLF